MGKTLLTIVATRNLIECQGWTKLEQKKNTHAQLPESLLYHKKAPSMKSKNKVLDKLRLRKDINHKL